ERRRAARLTRGLSHLGANRSQRGRPPPARPIPRLCVRSAAARSVQNATGVPIMAPVLITISGLPGSGKTTVARLVAAELGLEHVYAGNIFRRQAEASGLTLEEYLRRAETDPSIDRELDRQMEARAAQGQAVLAGRLAAFMAARAEAEALKVFLDASEAV